MYSKIYLRLEPLGLELAAAAARQAGHEVRLMDLQVETRADYGRLLERWWPEAVGFSLNYLANVPEVLDLVRMTRERLPNCFIFVAATAPPSPLRSCSATPTGRSTACCAAKAKPRSVASSRRRDTPPARCIACPAR
jgi:hypothetical protein